MKERVAAIFLGLIMIFSMAGFAILNVMPEAPAQAVLPSVVDRPLTAQEKSYLLTSNRAIIESMYTGNCTECQQANMFLESLVLTFPNSLAMSRSLANESSLQIIGRGGRITELEWNMTQEELFSVFCDVALAPPKECLLSEF